jgi:DNA/RNA-binding domain of Phe-tRNA-synthetase-like protein
LIQLSEGWRAAYPGASVGILAMRGAANPEASPLLERRRAEVEAELRSRYSGLDRPQLKAIPVLQTYGSYYKRFGKTYHLQLQLESVVLKNRPVPAAAALVEAMFMAELESLLLTAGHDLDALRGELTAEVASGEETYTLLGGQQQQLKPGDMFIRDREGVLSSVLYGPDQRTRLTSGTTGALFTVYVPAGIERRAVEEHLARIRAYVLLAAPGAELQFLGVAGGV